MAGVLALLGVERDYRAEIELENGRRLTEALAKTRDRLAERIDRSILVAEHLKAFMLTQPALPERGAFDRYSSQVIRHSPEVRALQYVDDGHRIRYIHPLEGNEEALGLDLMTRPAAPFVRRAVDTRQTTVADPAVTVQGSLSVVIRAPMFEGDHYLGLAAVVVDVAPLLEGLGGETAGYTLQIKDGEGHTFWGAESLSAGAPTIEVPVGAGSWTLALQAVGPAVGTGPDVRVLVWGLGGALLLSVLLCIDLVFRRVRGLAEAVEERTAELAASEARYRSLVETTDDAIVLADLDYRVIFANPAFYRSQGFEGAADADFDAFARLHPDDRDSVLKKLEGLRQKGTLVAEYRVRHRQGHWVYRRARFNLLRDKQGDPQSILMVANDFTERKLAERTLQFQARLLDMVEQAVMATDREGTITYWNRYAEELYGWSAAEALGRNVLELTPAEGSRSQAAEIMAEMQQGRSWSGEITLRRKDGSSFPALVTNSPVYGERGDHIGFVGVSVDVSERLRREKELSETKDLLEKTFASLSAAIFVIDPRGRKIVLCNPAVEDVFGYKPEELMGRGTQVLHADQAAYERFAEEGDRMLTQQGYYRTEYEMRHRDGHLIHTENTVLALADKENWRSQLAVSVVRDITEQKQVEAERNELEGQYLRAQKLEAVGQLTAGIAHDFNNLLMAITGNAQMMQLTMAEDDPFHPQVESIMEAGFKAADLISQLLVFSRKEVVRPQVVDLNAAVTRTGEMLQRVIGENIEFTLDLHDGLWPVLADPGQVDQVVANLAVNARDAMPQGGRLTMSTRNVVLDESQVDERLDQAAGDYVMLRVRDTGVGMSEAVQAHIFEPFFTTKQPGQGTGLGLATVYGIVKRCGGLVRVHSREGEGSTFEVYFPRTAEAGQEPADQPAPRQLERGQGTVMLVEDEAAVRELARDVLRRQGFTVLEAANGEEALQVLEAYGDPVELLITDVIMPGMSGRDLAEAVQRQHPAARVIYMSGYSYDIISNHGLLEPGIVLLQKPFSVFDLVEKAREVLG